MRWSSANSRPASTSPQIESVYRWKGEVEAATEWLLANQNDMEAFSIACAKLCVSCIPTRFQSASRLPSQDGSAAYLEWIGESVR
jgi:uncharacterized protein involved in tolerance to divalent cations